MSTPLDTEQFAKALNSEQGLSVPITAEGFVRKTDDQVVIEFSPAAALCVAWIKIPLKMIEKVQPLGKRPCLDHTHDYVVLYFQRPESPEAAVFAELLHHHAASHMGTLTRHRASHGPSPEMTFLAREDTYQMCFYERNGQYAGSAIYYSFDSAARACSNWQQFHGGTCLSTDVGERCPQRR